MIFQRLRNLSIRAKLTTFTLFLVLVPMISVASLSMARFSRALKTASEEDLEHLVRNVYAMCKVQQEMVGRSVITHLNVMKEFFYRHGPFVEIVEEKKIIFDVVQPGTHAISPVTVPLWKIGDMAISRDNILVDRASVLVGGTCSILQRIQGDRFLTIATNVTKKDEKRAVGTLIPSDSPVAMALLQGRFYMGRIFVEDDWRITAYEPIKDRSESVIGAFCVGVRSRNVDSLKDEIKSIKVGRTGYVYIIDGNGTLRMHPAKEGQNIIHTKDQSGYEYIRGMITDAKALPSGIVGTIRYPWINFELGETRPRQKIIKYLYFSPWDWIITAGSYEEEIYKSLDETQCSVLVMVVISIAMALVLTITLSGFLTRPIHELMLVTSKMMDGDLSQRVRIHGSDEIGLLGVTYNRMIGQIEEYTSNLEKMVEARTTELKDSRERYRDLSHFLNSILDSATEYAIIAVDFQGTIKEFNKGAEKMFAWKKDEVINHQNIAVTIAPEDQGIQKKILRRTRHGGVWEREALRIRKDGSRFPSHSTVTAIHGQRNELTGFVDIVSDITQQKSLERELRETKDFLENIMESSVDGIITTDLKGKITYQNRAMEKMIQSKRQEVIGKHISLFYVKGIHQAREIMDRLIENERAENYTMEIKGEDGKTMTFLTSLFLLRNAEDQLIGTAGIFKDISAQMLLEAKLQSTQAKLVEALKMRALGELVAGVAHEINNPLMASQTILYVLLNNLPQDSPERERLNLVRKCNDRIEKIVEHLRVFSRQTKPEYIDLDINLPIENALMMTEQQLLNHHISIEKRLSRDLPKISGDASQLEQAFLNLISNGRDAMDGIQKEKRLTISSYTVEEKNVVYVVASFRDTGMGIPEENLDKVLEPFFSTKEVGKGTGLGLTLCFGIMESHGGRVEIKSKVNEGTDVRVLIPALVPPKKENK